MAGISNIKKDMEFYKSLSALLKVLKGIAVAQFHILERKLKSFEEFHHTVEGLLGEIETRRIRHPFINPQTEVAGIVAVTSDSGLLGGLNMQIMGLALNELAKSKGGELVVVGERGKTYAREARVPFSGFPGIKDEERFNLAFSLRDHLYNRVMSGKIGVVKIFYPRALSLIVQRREKTTLLPYGRDEKQKDTAKIDLNDFILESTLPDIVEYLVFLWLGQKMYDILGQSRLAELAARFMHLEESSHRLEDVDKELKLKYFRMRHELTDRSMREIFASRLIYGH